LGCNFPDYLLSGAYRSKPQSAVGGQDGAKKTRCHCEEIAQAISVAISRIFNLSR